MHRPISTRRSVTLALALGALGACGEPDVTEVGAGAQNGGPNPTDPWTLGAAPGANQPAGAAAPGPKASAPAPRLGPPGVCAPADAFSYALCVCEDFHHAGQLLVGRGPSGEGSIGVNGTSAVGNHSNVAGSWTSYGEWKAGTGAWIGGSLRSGGDIVGAGAMFIGQDVSSRGDLKGAGFLEVEGALRVGGKDIFLGYRKVKGGRAAFNGPSSPPCGCEGNALFDVRAAVAKARTANDNGARGLDENSLISIGVSKLVLPTGRYYFTGVHTIGRGRLEIAGNVSLYIDGDLDQIGYEDIKIVPGASLDLYVAGTVRLVGYTPLGNPQSPSSFRLYIGGGERVSVSLGKQDFYGSIYAPTAEVHLAGDTLVVGSLFARQVAAAGRLRINHGGAQPSCTAPVPTTPVITPPPAPPPADPPPAPPQPAPPPRIIP